MGESQCPTCGHIVTGFEQQDFVCRKHELEAKDAEIERLRAALKPFAEPWPMGDAYVKFSPVLIRAARSALDSK